MSKIIKNPERQKNKDNTPAIPEYIRLNKRPMVNGFNAASNEDKKVTNVNFAGNTDDIKKNQWMIPLNTGGTQDNQWITFDGNVIEDGEDQSEYNVEEDDLIKESEAISNMKIKNGEYILMVSATVICSGTIEVVTNKINDIVYGNDIEFASKELEPDDFVVLKRMKLSFGVSVNND